MIIDKKIFDELYQSRDSYVYNTKKLQIVDLIQNIEYSGFVRAPDLSDLPNYLDSWEDLHSYLFNDAGLKSIENFNPFGDSADDFIAEDPDDDYAEEKRVHPAPDTYYESSDILTSLIQNEIIQDPDYQFRNSLQYCEISDGAKKLYIILHGMDEREWYDDNSYFVTENIDKYLDANDYVPY